MKVKVNDVEMDLEPGTSAIDAVFAAGYDVPYFCSQEYMSPIGACRMCLAKVGAPRKDQKTGEWILDEETGEPKIFYFPNLMATCTTAVMEGMVVDTLSSEVKGAQAGMMEFTLINHPLDCPTCDKGGACELQDRAYEYGSGVSRFQFTKRHQEKHHALSPLITLDRERCIHCKRCVRYFEEIPDDEVLDFIERGGHTYIGTEEEGLPSNFTGNITDICPVGALLDSTSRFRGRNWEYDHTRTTCLHCPVGCATNVDARTGRIERVKGARNTQVNNDWICDGGRFGHEYVDSSDRIRNPMIRLSGRLTSVTWDEAAEFVAEQLSAFGEGEPGIVLRADATLEEGVAAKSLAEHFKGGLDHFPRPAASVIPNAPQATLTDVATSDALLVIGDLTEEAPVVDLRIKEALKGVVPPELMAHGVPIADLRLKERAPRKRELLNVAAPYRVDLMSHAGSSVVYPAGKEAAFLQSLVSVANGETVDDAARFGMSQEDMQGLVTRLKDAEDAVIIYGGFVTASVDAAEAANALAKAVGAKAMAVGPMANSHGLERLGVLPKDTRHSYAGMLDGGARALLLSNLDPAADKEVAEKLGGIELLIVHSTFPTATTKMAHVVLPAKTGYEKEGTVVNIEGRYLNVSAAPVDGGGAEDFTGVVKRLGEALGTRLDGRSLRSAHRAFKKDFSIDLSELPDEGHLPPVVLKGEAPQGVEGRTEGNLLLVPTMVRAEHLGRNPGLRSAFGEAALRLHPADALARDLIPGNRVKLSVGGAMRRAVVAVDDGVPEGLMLLPALPEQPVGLVRVDVGALEKEVTEAPRLEAPLLGAAS